MRMLIADVVPIDGSGSDRAESVDVLIGDGRIAAVTVRGGASDLTVDLRIDGGGRLLLPGFVDAHSHALGRLGDPDVQLGLLRQGVTTVIGGQDGVGVAPGDGAYASEYFAAIDGPHHGYAGGGVGALLASLDGTSPLNGGYLVPAGTVRFEVMGRSTDAAGPTELAAMRRLVADGLADGALGVSTGLDYVPGRFASTAEMTELAREVAAVGGVVASHLRGGYESGSATGVAELAAIAHGSGAAVHVSHFHAEPEIVTGLMDALLTDGVDATFDAYPYTRGCSLLSMPLLPPELSVRPTGDVVAAITDPTERARLLADWFPGVVDYPSLGPSWSSMLTFGHIAAAEYEWAHGLTVSAAAARAGTTPAELVLDVLAAARLEVNVVMAVRYARSDADLARILAHPAAIGGSDGIWIGRHPHPRARGTFARYATLLVGGGSGSDDDRGVSALDWPGLATLCSTRAVDRFGLGDRGRVRAGAIADLVLAEPSRLADRATYDDPLAVADGIEDVLVAGVPVLRHGELTGATPGRGIRRGIRRSIRRS